MTKPLSSLLWSWRNGQQTPAAPPAPVRLAPEPPWCAQMQRHGIPRSLSYPSTTLSRLLDQTADRFGDTVALIYNDKRWTYRELLAQVNRMAGGLAKLGVRPEDRVLVALPNCPEFVISFFAVQKLGAVLVNAGPLMGADDLKAVIAMTRPRVVIGLDLQSPLLDRAGHGSGVEHWVWVTLQAYQPVLKRLGYQFKLWHNGPNGKAGHTPLASVMEQAPARPPTRQPDPNQVAVLQPTGGTTGVLKLAQLSHRNLLANATQIAVLSHCAPGQERVLAVLPMFHVYGLTTCLLSGIFTGSGLILMTRFNAAELLELIVQHRPTMLPLVPAICEALSNEIERRAAKNNGSPAGLEGLRLCISGAAPLPSSVAQRFERLTGATVIEGFGLSECSPVTHVNPPTAPRAGSIGLPLPDTRCRVVDPDTGKDVSQDEAGELLISGPQVMLGYFASPEQTDQVLTTDEHGRKWLHTGDIVRYDQDGYFYVLDRKKDMIIRSGLKVYPAKVEKVLRMHEKIKDAAVVGRPDPVHTEIVVAVLVTSAAPEARNALSDELRALCRQHLAPYEVPQKIEFVEQLPRSALGKLLKRELRRTPEPTPPPAGGNGRKDKSPAKKEAA